MSWDYRVLRHLDGSVAVYEVYYNDASEPVSSVETPADVSADTLEELRKEVEHMARALERPVLEYASFLPSDSGMPKLPEACGPKIEGGP